MPYVLRSSFLTTSITSIFVALSGCTLAPQVINLEATSPLNANTYQLGRTALVRVRDLRDETDRLGYRGGAIPQDAPLLTKPTLQVALTEKMQASLMQLGFGGASPIEPVKVDLAVEEFLYQCNEGNWVNQCDLSIEFNLTVINEGKTFAQPFNIKQQRSVAAAPRAGYNEEWVNEALNQLWAHMMTQPKVQQALGIN